MSGDLQERLPDAPNGVGVAADGVGVVILTHGAADSGVPLVRSLLDDGWQPSSIAVVQNPISPDQDALEPPDPAVTVIRPELNLGYAAGMNLGIGHHRRRGAEFLLLLTPDVRFRPGSARALLESLRKHPRYGLVGPVVFWPGTDKPFSYGGVVSWDGRSRHLGPDEAGTGEVEPRDWIDGCAVAIRTAVIDAVGPFDERFFCYYEESELCLRARRAGWEVGTVLGAAAEQSPGQGARPGAWAYLMCRNGLEYARLLAGRRAVASKLARDVRAMAADLKHAAIARWRGDRQNQSAAILAGRALGVVDFLLRRFGPPPAALPGLGDCQNFPARKSLGSRGPRQPASFR